MIVGCYSEFLRITRGSSESTIKHYVQALNTINRILQGSDLIIKNVFEITSASDLLQIRDFLFSNQEFLRKDSKGNNMYSAAFNHFYNFANDEAYYNSFRIRKLDAPIPVDLTKNIAPNNLLIEQSIRAENYTCTIDKSHVSFIDCRTNHPHMDGRHLIPLAYQRYFPNSLDVYANIVSLCPICHSKMHFGRSCDRNAMIEAMYDTRCLRLKAAGIFTSLDNVLEFNQCR